MPNKRIEFARVTRQTRKSETLLLADFPRGWAS
jgi:hypothetical protein